MEAGELDAWLEPLRALGLRRADLRVTLAQDLAFDDPVCSIVRGLTGQGVRRARCLTGAPRCEGCAETMRCDYAALVGTDDDAGGEVVRPWWLGGVPGESSQRQGARWEVRLVWVPRGAPRVSALVAALSDALERVGRSPLVRNRVEETGTAPVVWPAASTGSDAVRVVIESPFLVRLEGDDGLAKSAARCPEAPWLSLLAGAALRRVSALVAAFGGVRMAKLRLPDLHAVRVLAGEVRAWSGSRYSHRQGRRIPLRGFAGEAVIAGEGVRALGPLLHAVSVTGVGRSEALGFGSLRVEALP